VEARHLSGLPFLAADPNLFEKVIEANFVVGRNPSGNGGTTIGGIGEWAGQRVTRAVLRGVEVQAAVGEFDAPVGLPRNIRVVRDH
jgi:hypothetical protein